jgi:hypothetical protein
VTGETILSEEHLADGIHPGDEGHKRIASSVTKALGTALRSSGEAPEIGALRQEAKRLSMQTRSFEQHSDDYSRDHGYGSHPGVDHDERPYDTEGEGEDLAGSDFVARGGDPLDLDTDAMDLAEDVTASSPS